MGEVAIGITALFAILLVYLILIGLGIVSYVMTSLGFYTIAKRRQINNPWLAWIPFGNFWMVGAITSEYDARNGIKRKWNVVLIVLSLLGIGIFIVTYIALFIYVIVMVASFGEMNAAPSIGYFVPFIVLYVIMIIALMALAALQFCYYICVFKIFESTVPEKALKYLIISVLVPLGLPICLLRCKDKGYSVCAEPVSVPVAVTETANDVTDAEPCETEE